MVQPPTGRRDVKTLAHPVVHIPGLSGQYREISERYDYKRNRNRCPACEGLGTPWRGWFSCEECTAKALVKSGRCFVLLVDRLKGETDGPQ